VRRTHADRPGAWGDAVPSASAEAETTVLLAAEIQDALLALQHAFDEELAEREEPVRR
jgi:hypothetical protein